MYEKAYPFVLPYIQGLTGLLMPEHFWQAYRDRNQAAMQAEFEIARGLESRITEKYRLYSAADRRRVEEAYLAIIAELKRLQSAA